MDPTAAVDRRVDPQAEIELAAAAKDVRVNKTTFAGHAAEAIDDKPVRPVVAIGALGLPRNFVGQRLARMIVDELLERRTLVRPPAVE